MVVDIGGVDIVEPTLKCWLCSYDTTQMVVTGTNPKYRCHVLRFDLWYKPLITVERWWWRWSCWCHAHRQKVWQTPLKSNNDVSSNSPLVSKWSSSYLTIQSLMRETEDLRGLLMREEQSPTLHSASLTTVSSSSPTGVTRPVCCREITLIPSDHCHLLDWQVWKIPETLGEE